MLLLLEQNRNLQAEVQALRALVEEQGYEIRKLQRESLDRYTDTDNRLRNLEQSLASGAGTLTAPGSGAPDLTIPALPSDTVSNGAVASAPVQVTGGSAVSDPSLPRRGLVDNSGVGAGSAAASAPGVIPRTGSTRPVLEPAVLTEQQLYQMAYDSAINSQFERAIAEFDQYLGIYPQGRFTTNAHYWKGQSFLYLTRYDEAIAEYELILSQYPDDAKVPDAMYGQAVAYEGMGDTQRARRLLQQILRSYPNTGVANLADTRLRSLN
jgi:tol-pal system protein YbgF